MLPAMFPCLELVITMLTLLTSMLFVSSLPFTQGPATPNLPTIAQKRNVAQTRVATTPWVQNTPTHVGNGNPPPPTSNTTLLQAWYVSQLSDAQWQQLMTGLKGQGITSVVLQTTIDEYPTYITQDPPDYQPVYNTNQTPPPGYYLHTMLALYPTAIKYADGVHTIDYYGDTPGAPGVSPFEECLKYAQANSINVYVGLNSYPDAWGWNEGDDFPFTQDSAWCKYEYQRASAVATELYTLFHNSNPGYKNYSSFYGWYWPNEVDNVNFNNNTSFNSPSVPYYIGTSQAYANVITMLQNNFATFNSLNSAMPRMLSPFFNPQYTTIYSTPNTTPPVYYYTADDYRQTLQGILTSPIATGSQTPLFKSGDILALQDSAGDYFGLYNTTTQSWNWPLQSIVPNVSGNLQSQIDTWFYSVCQAVNQVTGMLFWSNADTYQVQTDTYDQALTIPNYWYESAPINRVSVQFTEEAKYVTNIMNCSNAFYDSPMTNLWSNMAYFNAWNYWYTNKTLNLTTPPAPTNVLINSQNGSIQLNWRILLGVNGDCGFVVWRDNSDSTSEPYIRSPLSKNEDNYVDTELLTFTDPDTTSFGKAHTYYLQDFDAFGNTSSVTTISVPASQGVQSVSATPTPVAGGVPSLGTVALYFPAGSSGTTVSLSSSNACVTVPSTVTVGAGLYTTLFNITTSPVSSNTQVTITATYGTSSATVVFPVAAQGLSSITISPYDVNGGSAGLGTATISEPAGTGGQVVTLSSNYPSVASVPATVTIPAGATSANFTVTTYGVSSYFQAWITGSVTSNSITTSLAAPVSVQAPAPVSLTVTPGSVVGGHTVSVTMTFSAIAPAGGLPVTVVSSNPSVLQIPSGITLAAGANTCTFTATTSPVNPGPVTVTLDGYLNFYIGGHVYNSVQVTAN